VLESRAVTRESRFVLTAHGDVRLMANAADPPGAMRFEFADDAGTVFVRDQLEDRSGIPYHAGLELQVAIQGSALDGRTFERAHAGAETILMLLSAASRAPTANVEPRLAYELPVTGKASALKQWFDASEIPPTPVPVPVPALDALWRAVHEMAVNRPELAQRVIISMSWYRRALREVEDLYRFQQLWLAFEAIDPSLADAYRLPASERAGFQGLRRLADEVGGGSQLVSTALGVRRDLFHTRRVLPDHMRARIRPVLAQLDRLVTAAWWKLLELPDDAVLPASSVRPFPQRFVVWMDVAPDEQGWSEDRHPHFDLQLAFARQAPAAPGQVTFSTSPSVTLHNAVSRGDLHFEQWGPETSAPPYVHY
jgi:hypothetical protein